MTREGNISNNRSFSMATNDENGKREKRKRKKCRPVS